MNRLRITAPRSLLFPVLLAFVASIQTGWTEDEPASLTGLIGYPELRTDLPGGRHANTSTSRAFVISLDGTGRRELVPHLAEAADTWTQFAGWSPDGATAIIGNGWQDPENAKWEEENKTFRMEPGKWRYDSWVMDLMLLRMASGSAITRTIRSTWPMLTELTRNTSIPAILSTSHRYGRRRATGCSL
jgi:TolB protein